MKLGYVIQYVTDVGAAVEFYERAFGFERRFLHEDNLYGELIAGSTILAFAGEEMAAVDGLTLPAGRQWDMRLASEIGGAEDDSVAAFVKPIGAGAVQLMF